MFFTSRLLLTVIPDFKVTIYGGGLHKEAGIQISGAQTHTFEVSKY
jgi:hypothetical protein